MTDTNIGAQHPTAMDDQTGTALTIEQVEDFIAMIEQTGTRSTRMERRLARQLLATMQRIAGLKSEIDFLDETLAATMQREKRLLNAIGLIEAWPGTPPHIRKTCIAARQP